VEESLLSLLKKPVLERTAKRRKSAGKRWERALKWQKK